LHRAGIHPLKASYLLSLVLHPLEHSAAARPPTGREPSEIAEAMSALAGESRVRMLYALLERERAVEELAGVVEMERSAVSQQLRILRQLRFVVAERDGRRMRYRLHDEHVAELLVAVRHHHEHARRGWPAPPVGRSSGGRVSGATDARRG
jgi:ArsR family transcriptional regulator, nickel/cobalt-responsive transcriptional repressor